MTGSQNDQDLVEAGGQRFDPDLVAALRPRYRLNWNGTHGWAHWVRVCENGLRLAETTGADREVVSAFALFHDIARRNDHIDPRHGARAATMVDEFDTRLLPLTQHQRELLRQACTDHTRGFTEADVTIQTCWDADRLDLGRIGIRPRPKRLCTFPAKTPEIIEWAWRRSRGR